jgi:diadenosine tetraphosphatase ApaH/serine/threonine PP2A family protein phosphatase
MRIAVLSDIHANLHALDAVCAEIAADSVDAVWCLGDIVGYGPRPAECVARVRELAALSLCGNHDLAVVGRLRMGDFSGDAAVAVLWTRPVLGDDDKAWLDSLAPTAAPDGAELFHGSPRDPVWDYVLSEAVASQSLARTTAPIVLVGHSHVALGLRAEGKALSGGVAPAGTAVELAGARVLLNPGSVGQPRDGDPRAAWLLLDLAAGTATFRRVPYDVAATQAEIRAAGLPGALAARLGQGQ